MAINCRASAWLGDQRTRNALRAFEAAARHLSIKLTRTSAEYHRAVTRTIDALREATRRITRRATAQRK